MSELFVYDLETLPNVFTAVVNRVVDDTTYIFEISPRKDQTEDFKAFCFWIRDIGGRMVGYNNIAFDYPVIHGLLTGVYGWNWYAECQRIFKEFNRKPIWNPVIPQVDLYKINHFDNKARRQSLKGVEFGLRMDNIQESSVPFGVDVPLDKIDELIEYNVQDVRATRLLLDRTMDAIAFRDELSVKYGKNFTNFSDVKCGTEVLLLEAEKHKPGSCYIPGTREPRQTKRDQINVGDILLPEINFWTPEFITVYETFNSMVVKETKGAIKDLNATVDGFTFHYGLGGIHGSVESQAIHSDDEYIIIDVDVASYYPNLAIANDIYPEHLSREFCDVYKGLYEQRKLHAKGTAENAMLKLALNGAYGNSNNPYSPLYDPQYTMAITVNGQLLLTMLSERLMAIPDCTMIQANTDGVTVRLPRANQWILNDVCRWWEDVTGLTLESAIYKSMFVADVNSYLSVYDNGKVKRIGRYQHEYKLHQDPSATILAMAAEAFLVDGVDVENFIRSHGDPHPFTLRAKMTGGSKCFHGDAIQQKVSRYHIATEGQSLRKVMLASGPVGAYKRKNKLTDEFFNTVMAEIPEGSWDERIHTGNKSVYADRESVISGGAPVVVCNNMVDFDWSRLDFDWYISETLKLVEVFK